MWQLQHRHGCWTLAQVQKTFNSVNAFNKYSPMCYVYRINHFRKTGENTFEPLSEQELARLSNVEMPESIEIDDSDNNDHHDSSDSDSDAGWETTEEVDDDGGVDDQENDG